MNSLRKWDGEVGEKAKSLVRKWKQLLPDSENATSSISSSSSTCASSSSSNITPAVNGTGESVASHNHSQDSHKKRKGGRLEEGGSTGTRGTHKSSTYTTDGLAGSSDCDDFSKALMMDMTASSSIKRTKEPIESVGSQERHHSAGDTHRHKYKHKHKHSHKESPSKTTSASLPNERTFKAPPMPVASTSTPKKPAVGVTPTISSLTRPKSPLMGSFLDTPPMPGGSGPTYSPRSEDSSPAPVVNSRKRKGLSSSVQSLESTDLLRGA